VGGILRWLPIPEEKASARPLPTLQFLLDGGADDISKLLPVLQHRPHAVLGAFRESGRDLFEIYLRSAHLVDITH
jgi:hypothetical protein